MRQRSGAAPRGAGPALLQPSAIQPAVIDGSRYRLQMMQGRRRGSPARNARCLPSGSGPESPPGKARCPGATEPSLSPSCTPCARAEPSADIPRVAPGAQGEPRGRRERSQPPVAGTHPPPSCQAAIDTARGSPRIGIHLLNTDGLLSMTHLLTAFQYR